MRAGNKRDQLAEVLGAFEVKVAEGDLLTRCARCNGEFIPRYCSRAKHIFYVYGTPNKLPPACLCKVPCIQYPAEVCDAIFELAASAEPGIQAGAKRKPGRQMVMVLTVRDQEMLCQGAVQGRAACRLRGIRGRARPA